MDNTDLYIKIDNNIRNLNSVEDSIATLQYTIYQTTINQITAEKNLQLRDYIIGQAEFYDQKIDYHKDIVNSIFEEYDYQMKRITKVYDKMFVDVVKVLKNACNNQKIAVTNIITLDNKYNQEYILTDKDKANDIKALKRACAQKKVNYSVIINECKARIKWIIENVQKDIDTLFDNSTIVNTVGLPEDVEKYKNIKPLKQTNSNDNVLENNSETQLSVNTKTQILEQINNASLFEKIFRYIKNLISGSSKFDKVINNYRIDLSSIKSNVDNRINELAYILAGITKQFETTKKKINIVYNTAVKNNSLSV